MASRAETVINERARQIGRSLELKPDETEAFKQDVLRFSLANWSKLQPLFLHQANYSEAEGLTPCEYWVHICWTMNIEGGQL